jgi:PAS domain S-box-containing protein
MCDDRWFVPYNTRAIRSCGEKRITRPEGTESNAIVVTNALAGGGEVGALMRGHDWSATPLGPTEFWPEALKTVVGIILASSQPMFVIWGQERVLLYNDGYASLLGNRHPSALARPFAAVWRDIEGDVVSFLDHAFAGEPSAIGEIRLDLNGTGGDVVYLTYSSTPMRDENGAITGVFCTCADITDRVHNEQRNRFMTDLGERLRVLDDARQVMAVAAEMVGKHLQVNRCGYGEIDASERFFTVEQDWTDGTMPSIAGRIEIAGFGDEVIAAHKAGLAVRMDDVRADRRAEGSQAAYEAIRTRAGIGVPLIKDGRLQALFYVHHAQPRTWTNHDEILVREVAERTWNAVKQARAEAALRKSESRLRALVNASSYVVYTISPDWSRVLDIAGNPYAPDTWMATGNWRDAFIAPEDRRRVDAAIAAAIRDKTVLDIEHRIRRPDGSLAWVRSCSVPFRNEADEIVEWFGGATDVTERRLAMERLREHEERLRLTSTELRAVLDAAPIAVWFTADPEARYWRRNRKAAEWLGLPVDADPLSSDWQEMSAATSVRRSGVFIQQADYPLNRAVRGEEIRDDIIRIEATDGTVRDILCNAVPLRDSAGRISGAVCAGTDITAQLTTERRLRDLTAVLEDRISDALAERKILADVVAGADAFVQVVDLNYRWLAINEASAAEFERIYRVRPKPGDSVLDLLAPFPEQQAQVRHDWSRALAGEEFTELRVLSGPGPEPHYFELRFNALRDRGGERIGAYQFAYDVTERVESQAKLADAQAQLHEMQKLETIGQLTGNVAHDFNNLLTPIVGTLEILGRKAADERAQMMARGALQAADRARNLVQRLLAFARRQHLEARPVAVAPLIDGLSDLIRRSIGPAIEFKIETGEDLPPAQVDPNQLELALLNLAVNARDAMPDGGKLTVTAEAEQVDRARNLKGGLYVRISVSDTGIGMDAETLRRAVEPFFTTKSEEKGTGLGLSMVHGLAAQSGGDLAISSAPGQGTTAIIWLPVSDEPELKPALDAGVPAEVLGRTETILLVDDEPLVRTATAGMLTEAGFKVIEADSGETALELMRGGCRVDGVVTDYTMPGMSGVVLANRLRELEPTMPILLITGYASIDDPQAGTLARLAKPFRQRDLVARLAALLDHN